MDTFPRLLLDHAQRRPDAPALREKAYGVWQKKKNYGREYIGIVRSTFLIDEKGKIAEVWSNVRVKGHVDKVLEAAQSL